MKKLLALMLAMVMVFGLAACGQTAAPAASAAPAEADVDLLEAAETEEFYTLCSELLDYYAGGNVCTMDTAEKVNMLTGLLDKKDGA